MSYYKSRQRIKTNEKRSASKRYSAKRSALLKRNKRVTARPVSGYNNAILKANDVDTIDNIRIKEKISRLLHVNESFIHVKGSSFEKSISIRIPTRIHVDKSLESEILKIAYHQMQEINSTAPILIVTEINGHEKSHIMHADSYDPLNHDDDDDDGPIVPK